MLMNTSMIIYIYLIVLSVIEICIAQNVIVTDFQPGDPTLSGPSKDVNPAANDTTENGMALKILNWIEIQ